jgi:tripartite-type tricarboxylate transporter receptor subunit TctC
MHTDNFCTWPRALPLPPRSLGSQGRKPIRRGRCASWSEIPPGSGSDIIARLRGQRLSERLGQQFIVENRPGAGGNIATEMVARSSPDGYTLLLVGSNKAINATLYDRLDFIRDIAPVASIIRVPLVMDVNPSVPAKTVSEFIAYAKANPGKLSMASAGNGSASHVAGELFKFMAGVDMVHVPYGGSTPALTDLLADQVQVLFDVTPSFVPHIRVGSLRPLAVATATRLEVPPEIPIMRTNRRAGARR